MKSLNKEEVMKAAWSWAKDNCRCGNMAVDGDLWRGDAHPGWVACETCHTNHYFLSNIGWDIEVLNLLIEEGYLQ